MRAGLAAIQGVAKFTETGLVAQTNLCAVRMRLCLDFSGKRTVGGTHSGARKTPHLHRQTRQKTIPVARLFGRPGDLGQCRQPRKHHILHPRLGAHMFAPDIGLGTQHMPGLLFTEISRNRFKPVYGFQRIHLFQ